MHTERCIEMALMSIAENNETTRVLEPSRDSEPTPETRAEALEWLANGNAECYTPELCSVS